jgi:hypothetical protein
MTGQFDERALIDARVRFRSQNDVIEGVVQATGHHLVLIKDDDGGLWKVDRYSLRVIEDGPGA